MIGMMTILLKYKDSPEVKNLTKFIRPIIAVLLAFMTIQFGKNLLVELGMWSSIILIIASLLLLVKFKVHPAFVILLALIYGAITG